MKSTLPGILGLIFFALCSWAQINQTLPVHPSDPVTNSPMMLSEKIRAECIAGRRSICGRIVKLLPDGIVVESGYTSLKRPELVRNWLVPGTVVAERDPTLVEGKEPGTMAVGLVYLTDLPKSRRAKPKLYDYVIIAGFPAGQFTYVSVGEIHRTVRRFSAVVENAVRIRYDALAKSPDPAAPVK